VPEAQIDDLVRGQLAHRSPSEPEVAV
jgi:hypothetical protein